MTQMPPSNDPVAVVAAHLAAHDPGFAAAVVEQVLGDLTRTSSRRKAMLLDTITAWLAADQAQHPADRLGLSRTAVRYRLQRVEDFTGRRLACPRDAAELHLAVHLLRALTL